LLIGLHSGCGLCSWLVFGLLAKGGVLELSKRVNGFPRLGLQLGLESLLGHLSCGGKIKNPEQPSWERCPGGAMGDWSAPLLMRHLWGAREDEIKDHRVLRGLVAGVTACVQIYQWVADLSWPGSYRAAVLRRRLPGRGINAGSLWFRRCSSWTSPMASAFTAVSGVRMLNIKSSACLAPSTPQGGGGTPVRGRALAALDGWRSVFGGGLRRQKLLAREAGSAWLLAGVHGVRDQVRGQGLKTRVTQTTPWNQRWLIQRWMNQRWVPKLRPLH